LRINEDSIINKQERDVQAMSGNEDNQRHFEDYNNYGPETGESGQYYASDFESPVIGDTESYRPSANEPADIPVVNRKRRRPALRAAAAIVLCMALMLGSGFAGARIAVGRLDPLQGGNQYAQESAYPAEVPGSDSGSVSNGDNYNGGNSGDRYNDINPLGRFNPDGESLSLTELFAGANPAVVAISTQTTGRNAFGRVVTLPAAGSGFIISGDGYIVTNNHVIENATSISVLLHDGTNYPAVLAGRDPDSDLAVLKIDANDLSYLTWGNSGALLVGEQVAAIGNPLGEFANSMTVGYISALDREINIDGTPRNMLQTDAAVNSGNSGGPLLNLKGQVIGIVTAKSSGMNVEGLGFAIPSNTATRIVEQLITDGYIKGRAVLGVMISMKQEDDDKTSVYVESVNDGSAAEKAGLEAGDMILSANGADVSTIGGLKDIINALSPGDRLTLKIQRGNDEMSLTAILDEYRPSDPAPVEPPFDNDSDFPYGDDDSPWRFFPDMDGVFPWDNGN